MPHFKNLFFDGFARNLNTSIETKGKKKIEVTKHSNGHDLFRFAIHFVHNQSFLRFREFFICLGSNGFFASQRQYTPGQIRFLFFRATFSVFFSCSFLVFQVFIVVSPVIFTAFSVTSLNFTNVCVFNCIVFLALYHCLPLCLYFVC